MKNDSGTLGSCIIFIIVVVLLIYEIVAFKSELRTLRQEAVDTGHADWVVEGGQVKGVKFK